MTSAGAETEAGGAGGGVEVCRGAAPAAAETAPVADGSGGGGDVEHPAAAVGLHGRSAPAAGAVIADTGGGGDAPAPPVGSRTARMPPATEPRPAGGAADATKGTGAETSAAAAA